MAIDRNLPEIYALKECVKEQCGLPLAVHSDFQALSEAIFKATREHVSETTLERLWGYSTRGYNSVSRRTIDVLCLYSGHTDWQTFLTDLKKAGGVESELFDLKGVDSNTLPEGARLQLGWLPDRVCVIRHLGAGRYEAEKTHNSKLQAGDTFYCRILQFHGAAYLEDLRDHDGKLRAPRYGIGLEHGLTMLRILKES